MTIRVNTHSTKDLQQVDKTPITSDGRKKFTVQSVTTIASCRKLELKRATVSDGDTSFQRCFVGHPQVSAVVAWNEADSTIAFVREYRTAVERSCLEVPGGEVDDTDQSPTVAAIRELEEEAGVRAAKIQQLGKFYNSPGHCTQLSHVFLATELVPTARRPDGPEESEMEVVWLSNTEIRSAIAAGVICDSKTLVSLSLFWLYQDR